LYAKDILEVAQMLIGLPTGFEMAEAVLLLKRDTAEGI
jgi:hypothetical protein